MVPNFSIDDIIKARTMSSSVATPVSTPVVSTPVVSTNADGLATWTQGSAESFADLSEYMSFMSTKLAGTHMQELAALALASFVAKQNLLLAGLHGEAKTTFAEVFADVVDNSVFKRAQFTPTTPPEVVVGGVPLKRINEGVIEYKLEEGIVSGHLVLLDEIDKASARTQQLLLEYLNTKSVINRGQKIKTPTEMVLATRNDELDLSYFSDRFSACYHFKRTKPSSFMSDYAKMLDTDCEVAHKRITKSLIVGLRVKAHEIFQNALSDVSNTHLDVSNSPIKWLLAFLDAKNDAFSRFGGISPRKVKNALQLVCAWSALHDHDEVLWADLYATHFAFDSSVQAETIKAEIMSSLVMVQSSTDPYPLVSGKVEAENNLRKQTRDRLQQKVSL